MSTHLQIVILIALILSTVLLYWTGYRSGHIEGRVAGIDEGMAIQKSDSTGEIRELQRSLNHASDRYKQLYAHYERALADSAFGPQDREILLAIAKQLKLAAETFRSLKSDEDKRALSLSHQALAMAARLEPVAEEQAA